MSTDLPRSGGSVSVTSAEGEGTTVSLLLPRCTAPLLPPELEAASQVFQPASASVLLVEDNEEVAEVTTAMLETLSCVVTRVASARLALEHLENGNRVDLVLTDIVMPGGVSGIDVARAIRERHPQLPVLLTPGYSAVAREAVDEGFALISKPFHLGVLETAIRSALDHGAVHASNPQLRRRGGPAPAGRTGAVRIKPAPRPAW